MIKIETTTRKTKFHAILHFQAVSMSVCIGDLCGSESFTVQFGNHFRSGDDLRSGIICCDVHIPFV